jgi:hypothetical protein
VSSDAVHQPTWPLLPKIEHMVKLQVFGNNSKTVSNIKNLTWDKNDQHIKNTRFQEIPGGFAPLDPLSGFVLDPLGSSTWPKTPGQIF